MKLPSIPVSSETSLDALLALEVEANNISLMDTQVWMDNEDLVSNLAERFAVKLLQNYMNFLESFFDGATRWGEPD